MCQTCMEIPVIFLVVQKSNERRAMITTKVTIKPLENNPNKMYAKMAKTLKKK